ncbi:MAG: RecQ family ATP-dependent DNA helicase [Nocardioides sp.]
MIVAGEPVPATTEQRALAEAHLRALVGRDDAVLRNDQWAAIEALVVHRRRTLVVQRTGWGKSAVYFVATLLLRADGAGPTVIVSPLLALMRNQILAARRAGVRAVTINSTNLDDWQRIHADVAAGEIDVLLISPERLNNPGFRDEVLPRLAATAGMLVIDEAHCISDWGHDFRPDYRRIRTMLGELPEGIAVLATTATANQRVTTDVAEQLATNGSRSEVLVLRGDLDRSSLHLAVVRLPTAAQRLAWLAERLGGFPGSGIVYCLTVAATTDVADFLASRGHAVAAYSGQTEPAVRERLEGELLAGHRKALVATSALGMGFDAPLGFVINLGAPQSPVAYYQQVGRAGRGTDRADVVLLPAPEDRDIWQYFASLAFPPEAMVRHTLSVLAQQRGPVSTAVLETYVDLSRTRLEAMLKVLDVDGAVRRVRGGWEATGMPWVYDDDRYRRVAAARTVEQQAMLDYIATDRCRMWFLRDQLDDRSLAADPGVSRCGRCDNCGATTWDGSIAPDLAAEAGAHLARPGVVLEPRKMWPSGLANLGMDLRGKITPSADAGRAVARLSDLGRGELLRELFAPEGPDGPVPVPLVAAVLEMLAEWFRDELSPTAIVSVESRRRPVLTADLADGLSRHLRVPVVGRFAIVNPDIGPNRGAANSAQRVAAVCARYSLVTLGTALSGHHVLLADDLVGTGWTATVAAQAILSAGARSVRPLALGTGA